MRSSSGNRMNKFISEPYRLFFPLGTFFFLCGILLWVPLIFFPSEYPVLLHRSLMLTGFTGAFIGGFLMTAVPKFSGTSPARSLEVILFFLFTLIGLGASFSQDEKLVILLSTLQPLMILFFLFSRILKRKQNPPYSFIFIFVGLILWIVSGILGFQFEPEDFKRLHYEGAISAIILGVGSRLIPGILGHVEIVKTQREAYERPVPLLRTVPIHFFILIALFITSYFLSEEIGNYIRLGVVAFIGLKYWLLYKTPKDKTALTWCIWISGWLIVLSFLLRALLSDAGIHASHALFINGIALLSFLIATRVIQSHGPDDKSLENKKTLFVVTALIFLSSATRISAYLMPETYLRHLSYSAIVLALAVIIWASAYLKFIKVKN